MNVETDLIFVFGLLFGVLAFPALLSAFSEGRAPRAAALLIVMAIGMITYAVVQRPSGYTVEEVPQVVKRVFASVLN